MTYERVDRGHARMSKRSNPPKRSVSPSIELLGERRQKRLRLEEDDDEDYEDTSSEEETSNDGSAAGNTNDRREGRINDDTSRTNHRECAQIPKKPFRWDITTPTSCGPTHIPEANGSLADSGGTGRSAVARNKDAYQHNNTPSGSRSRNTDLGGKCMTPAAQNLLRAAQAIEQHETDLKAIHVRQETQISFLKEELERMRQEIARMKQAEGKYARLERRVEEVRSSRRAEADEELLRQVQKRLDDNEESYNDIKGTVRADLELLRKRMESVEGLASKGERDNKANLKTLLQRVEALEGLASKEKDDIKDILESLQKRVGALEGLKSVSAFDMLQRLVGPNGR
ncbi:hypothetical protein BJY01DRAFT_41154 [Aspergillus pseudoustus]|uniref:SWI5-dependent HO expression protein 3 n=1 Tax=Aspergillus pseudoustus TaxID=1810923 RepID=A0ABR4JCC4_9EURO